MLLDSISLYRRRTRITALAIAGLIGAFFVVVNAPWRYATVHSVWVGDPFFTAQRVPEVPAERTVRAGWPWRYLYNVDNGAGRVNGAASATKKQFSRPSMTTYWSTPALIGDVILSLVLVVLAYRWWCWRGNLIAFSVSPAKTRRRFDLSIAAASFLIPGGVIAASSFIANQQFQMVRQLSCQGGYQFTFESPTWLQDRIPPPLHDFFVRLRFLDLYSPKPEDVRVAIRTKSLRSVLVVRATLESDTLDELHELPQLSSFSLNDCEASTAICEDIERCPRLLALGMYRCELDSQVLASLSRLRLLRFLDLRKNSLQLAELGRPEWADSVETLVLSRPASGKPDHVQLNGWPALKRVSITDSIRISSDATLKLSLTDLPLLEEIFLDRSQKHSLIARNLPRFQRVVEPVDLMLLYGQDTALAGLTRWEEVELENLPSLQKLDCYAPDLKRMSLKEVPRLERFRLGVFAFNTSGQIEIQTWTPTEQANWLDQITKVPSIRTVELVGVDLQKQPAEQLTRLPYLARLRITGGGLSCDQLEWVFDVKPLKELRVQDCRITTSWLQRCLVELPGLRQLQADLSELRELRVTGNRNLSTLDYFTVKQLTHLELTDLPRLRGSIQVRGPIEQLTLIDLPRLDELMIESPWPRDAKLSGLNSLRYFGAGGPGFTDKALDELLQCKKLDHLILAYPDVSAKRIQRLGRYRYLTGLELPGCPVDDQVVSYWSKMDRLRIVNFDDTRVSTGTLQWLHSIESLRELSMARVSLDEEACRWLASLFQLSGLNLEGVDFPVDQLERILDQGHLETLDLTGCEIGAEHLAIIAGAKSLKRLIIRDCSLPPNQMAELLSENPGLLVDVGDQQSRLAFGMDPELTPRLLSQNATIRTPMLTSQLLNQLASNEAQNFRRDGPAPLGEPSRFNSLQAADESTLDKRKQSPSDLGRLASSGRDGRPSESTPNSKAEKNTPGIKDERGYPIEAEQAFAVELFRPKK